MFFLQQGLKSYWEKRRDGSLKLATIRDDTWNVLNMQHITPNLKRWDYSDITGGSHGQIKGPTHMVEGGHHPRNRPPTLGTMSVDFYHYPVTVWAYSTPQPNTEVPAPTGGSKDQETHYISLYQIWSYYLNSWGHSWSFLHPSWTHLAGNKIIKSPWATWVKWAWVMDTDSAY